MTATCSPAARLWWIITGTCCLPDGRQATVEATAASLVETSGRFQDELARLGADLNDCTVTRYSRLPSLSSLPITALTSVKYLPSSPV